MHMVIYSVLKDSRIIVNVLKEDIWVSEASPTLGCSIEISRDIYMCRFVCPPYAKCIGGITWPKHEHAQSQFWAVKPTCDTRIIHFYYTLEQL